MARQHNADVKQEIKADDSKSIGRYAKGLSEPAAIS
jgi:hypothetical protein